MNIDAEVQDHNESVRINAQDVGGSVGNETQFQKLYRLQSKMMHEALNEGEDLPPIETNNEKQLFEEKDFTRESIDMIRFVDWNERRYRVDAQEQLGKNSCLEFQSTE